MATKKYGKGIRRKTREAAEQQIKENGHKAIAKSRSGHKAFLFVNAYYRGNIDLRSHLGQITKQMETEYAEHMGYQDFDSCPITLSEQIRLLVGNYLFQAFYLPSNQTLPHLRASENLTHRITRELGLKPEPKSVQDLQTYMKEKYGK